MPRKEKKFHFIYKTTNLLSGKYYIGMHSTDNLEDGYLGSGKRLRYSVNKYGKENHIREILEYFDTREELARRECEVVCLDEIAKEECINLCVGGEGGRCFTEEQRIKGAKRMLEIIWNDKEFISRHTNRGTVKFKKLWVEGKLKLVDWTGKKHSQETRDKMCKSRVGTGLKENNSQFGTCWITNGIVNKKIKKSDLNIWIPDGWYNGRNRKK